MKSVLGPQTRRFEVFDFGAFGAGKAGQEINAGPALDFADGGDVLRE
jgi:hypothetical protein